MKRTIAFMLVLALAIACVPAFAAPASNKAENTMEMQPAFDQISVDNSGNIVKASEMRATKTETMDGISIRALAFHHSRQALFTLKLRVSVSKKSLPRMLRNTAICLKSRILKK